MSGLDAGDLAALAELSERYAALVDDRRLAELVELFTDDAVLVTPDPPRELRASREHIGRAGVAAALEQVLVVPRTRHTVSGRTFDPGGEPGTARGRVVGSAHHLSERPDDSVIDLVWQVSYRDAYRFGDGSWRFSRRELSVDWIEVRPVRQWRRD